MKYNGGLTREQFMFNEMRITARLLSEGLSDQEVLERVYNENLFQYPTEKEIKSKCKACLKRLAYLKEIPELMEALTSGTISEAKQAALIAMMLQSRLLAEFMITVIGEKYRSLDMTMTKKDMNVFFSNLAQQDEDVAGWSEKTVNKIKVVIRNCLRETEYIPPEPGSETLLPVYMSEELVQVLKDAGLSSWLPAFNVIN